MSVRKFKIGDEVNIRRGNWWGMNAWVVAIDRSGRLTLDINNGYLERSFMPRYLAGSVELIRAIEDVEAAAWAEKRRREVAAIGARDGGLSEAAAGEILALLAVEPDEEPVDEISLRLAADPVSLVKTYPTPERWHERIRAENRRHSDAQEKAAGGWSREVYLRHLWRMGDLWARAAYVLSRNGAPLLAHAAACGNAQGWRFQAEDVERELRADERLLARAEVARERSDPDPRNGFVEALDMPAVVPGGNGATNPGTPRARGPQPAATILSLSGGASSEAETIAHARDVVANGIMRARAQTTHHASTDPGIEPAGAIDESDAMRAELLAGASAEHFEALGIVASRSEAPVGVRLTDLANELAGEHGERYEPALTAITTYAAQLGYSAFAGGQSPTLLVSTEDADIIRTAYRFGNSAILGEVDDAEPAHGHEAWKSEVAEPAGRCGFLIGGWRCGRPEGHEGQCDPSTIIIGDREPR